MGFLASRRVPPDPSGTETSVVGTAVWQAIAGMHALRRRFLEDFDAVGPEFDQVGGVQ